MTRGEFARHIDVRPSYVTKLARADRLVFTPDGRHVLVAESVSRIAATRDPSRPAQRDLQRTTTPETPQRPEKNADDDAPDGKDTSAARSFSAARADREWYNAGLARLEYQRVTGTLCETDTVHTAAAQAGGILRAAIERLPDAVAGRMADDPAVERRVRAAVQDEVDVMLGDIALTLQRILDDHLQRDETRK